jgi:hypothetical protein
MSIGSFIFRTAANVVVPGSGVVMSVLAKVRAFLAAIPWQVYAVLGAIAGVLILWHVHTHEVAAARAEGFKAGQLAEQATFKAVQDKADAIQRAKNTAQEAASTKIDTEKTDAYLDANDAIDRRAAAIRVRHDAAQRTGGILPLPEKIDAPGGAAAQATCDGLPFDVAIDALTRAAKLEAQLNAILDWEDAQDKLAAKDGADGSTDADKAASGP